VVIRPSVLVVLTALTGCTENGRHRDREEDAGISGPFPVPTSIDCASHTTCVVFSDGSVRCWGRAGDYGLGDPAELDPGPVPVLVKGISRVRSVHVGSGGFVCAILEDGYLACWGESDSGEILGVLGGTKTPTIAQGIEHVRGVSASGATHVVLENGRVLGWGNNSLGVIGDGTDEDRLEPVTVFERGIIGVEALLAVGERGNVWCWGPNWKGLTGEESLMGWKLSPVVFPGLNHLAGVDLYADEVACAWTRDGEAYCWGHNSSGQIVLPPGGKFASPVRADTPAAVRQASVGAHTVCFLLESGAVHCQGSVLGDGNTTLPLEPTAGLRLSADICVGSDAACALERDPPRVVCWGYNYEGQLGRPGPDSLTPVPVEFPDLPPVEIPDDEGGSP